MLESEVGGVREGIRRLEESTPRRHDVVELTRTLRDLNGRLGTTERSYASLSAEVAGVRGRMLGIGAVLAIVVPPVTAVLLRLLGQ